MEIINITEKPSTGTEPSKYATHGAYILTPEIFTALDKTKPGSNGELRLIDVINNMKGETGLLAKIISDGHYLDCGDPLSYLYSQMDYFINYSSYPESALEKLRSGVCRIDQK